MEKNINKLARLKNINNLARLIFNNNKDKGFHDQQHTPEHMLCLVISELMEAVEADRKGRFHYSKSYTNKKERPKKEQWANVIGYEDSYMVSNYGRVRSKNMRVWGGRAFYEKKGCILRPGLGGTGYYTVSLRGKTHKVAVLVANAFIDNKNGLDVVNHIDGDKTNDCVSNLEWVSYSQNSQHAYNSGLHKPSKIWKIPYSDRCEIAFKKKSGINYSTIFKNKSYGVTKSAIQRICREYEKYTDSVEMELADAVIRLLDAAGALDERLSIESVYLNKEKATERLKGLQLTESLFKLITTITYTFQFYGNKAAIENGIGELLAICSLMDIDVMYHVELKLRYNETRAYKHGKRY